MYWVPIYYYECFNLLSLVCIRQRIRNSNILIKVKITKSKMLFLLNSALLTSDLATS